MDDQHLMRECREERYRASGPGGQRRNKVATAVRLRHEDSGVVVQAGESRSLEENRQRAAKRLRERIAIEVRAPFDLKSPALPEEFAPYRSGDGKLKVNKSNPHYPIVVATVLDALAAAEGSYARAAAALGVTTSQLMRFLQTDQAVWRSLSETE